MDRILKTLRKDLLTRGKFDFNKYITNGVVFITRAKGTYEYYIRPESAEDWRVSTSLIFYHQIARDVEERNRENQY